MKEERSEMEEIIRNAQPREVGGIFRESVGAKEAAERMKRTKFKNERSRLRKEHDELLRFFDEAISMFVLSGTP